MQLGQALSHSVLLPFSQGKTLRTKEMKPQQVGIRVDPSLVPYGIRSLRQMDEVYDKFFSKQRPCFLFRSYH